MGKGTQVESSRVREPRRTALSRGCNVGFYGDGINFQVVFGQSFQFRVFPGGACISQPRWMLARGILGSGWTRSVSFRPFPNSSSWWWFISSVFLIRISCHKTTHANGCYGARPRVGSFNQCASLTVSIEEERGPLYPQGEKPGSLPGAKSNFFMRND